MVFKMKQDKVVYCERCKIVIDEKKVVDSLLKLGYKEITNGTIYADIILKIDKRWGYKRYFVRK